MAKHILSNQNVAIKIIKQASIADNIKLKKVKLEAKILSLFRHPHVMRVYELIESSEGLFIVMEYLSGGELYDYIIKKGSMTEDEARNIFQQLVFALDYTHKHKVVHRDIKPENILLDEHNNIKIGDFGLASYFHDGIFLRTSCGSLNYAAPEVLTGDLYSGPEIDIWSSGVVLFVLLTGNLPFDDNNISMLLQKIKRGEFEIPPSVSGVCQDLIRRILNIDPVARIKISQIFKHPWFRINLPNHLSYMISCLDPSIDLLSINSIRPKYRLELDPELFEICVIGSKLALTVEQSAKLKKKIMKDADDEFCVHYNMLHDAKQKKDMLKLNHANLDINPVFEPANSSATHKSTSNYQDSQCLLMPHNWVYGFRSMQTIIEYMNTLFKACIKLKLVRSI